MPTRTSRAVRAGVFGVALCLASLAAAEPEAEPRYQLAYEPPPADDCPTEAALRDSVAAELGYDAFTDDATRTIVVTIRPQRGRVRGRIELRAEDGRRLGARELSASSCAELTPALALALAVAIDPLRAGAHAPAAASPPVARAAESPPPSLTPELPPLLLPAKPEPPPSRWARLVASLQVRVAIGVHLAVESAPGPAFGFLGRVGVGGRRWTLAVEGRGDLQGASVAEGGRALSSLMAASLVPCVHHRAVAFCAVGAVGGQNVEGDGYFASRSSWVPWAALGGRVELELPVNRLLSVLLRLDVLAPLTRTVLVIGSPPVETVVYRTAPICNTFGVALSTR